MGESELKSGTDAEVSCPVKVVEGDADGYMACQMRSSCCSGKAADYTGTFAVGNTIQCSCLAGLPETESELKSGTDAEVPCPVKVVEGDADGMMACNMRSSCCSGKAADYTGTFAVGNTIQCSCLAGLLETESELKSRLYVEFLGATATCPWIPRSEMHGESGGAACNLACQCSYVKEETKAGVTCGGCTTPPDAAEFLV